MARRWHPRSAWLSPLSLVAVCGGLFLASLSATDQIQPGIGRGPIQLQTRFEDDDLLSRHLAQQRPQEQGTLASMRGRTIQIGEQATETLGVIADRAFEEQAGFLANVRRLPAGQRVLTGAAQSEDTVFALPQVYVLAKSTRVNVADPRAFAAASPEFRTFLEGRPPAGEAITIAPFNRTNATRLARDEALKLPEGDALRETAKLGDDAAYRAAVEGRGTFAITDTLVVPRTPLPLRNGRLVLPATGNTGLLDYGRLQPVDLRRLGDMTRIDLDRGVEARLVDTPPLVMELILPPAKEPVNRSNGESHRYTAAFLAGFTRGHSWEWERRWDYPTGFFRVTLGAGYGLGLRVPIEVTGTVSPTGFVVADSADRPSSFRSTVTVATKDADAGYFRATGLDRDQVFEGHEVVLEAQVGIGYKFRVFWTNVAHQRYRTYGFPFSQDAAPFLGPGRVPIHIPAKDTHTEIGVEGLRGYVQAGIDVEGSGEVKIDHEFIVGGETVDRRTLTFDRGGSRTLDKAIPQVTSNGTRKYGIKVSNPRYHATDLTATPKILLGLNVGYGDFSRRFSSAWIRFNSAKLDLGDVQLNRHRGTRVDYTFDRVRKMFHLLEGPVRAHEVDTRARTVLIQSAFNRNYMRIDTSPGRFLHADEPSADRTPRFRVVPLPGTNRIALRVVASGRYVGAGVDKESWLAADSERIDVWQTFELVGVSGDQVALKAVRSGRYVRGGGINNRLAAASDRIDAWETFRLVDVR